MNKIVSIYRRIINTIRTTIKFMIDYHKIKKEINKDEIFGVLTGVSVYGNVGDLAITIANEKLFDDVNIKYVEMPITVSQLYSNYISKHSTKNMVIINQGGGNMGTNWFEAESCRRNKIERFHENKIVVFPQTIDYDQTCKGKEQMEESVRIYSDHPDLYLFAREQVSYDIMKKQYKNNHVELVPDIVLYLNEGRNYERKGIFFAIRKDKEKKVSSEQINEIIDMAKKIDDNVTIGDTVIDKTVLKNKRNQVFQSKLDEFRKSKLVVTDRLHGMIFAAITETPCVVLSNSNHKVKGVYEWIKHLGYVKYIEDCDNVEQYMRKLYNKKDCKYDNKELKKYYQKIIDCIKTGE